MTETTATTRVATPTQIEGPYWLPGSPARSRLVEADTVGDPLVLSGHVYSTSGAPIGGAWIDVWQADGAGTYDIDGSRLRGHQWTDDAGRYRVETVLPGDYEEHFALDDGRVVDVHRTPHVHVKVKARRRQTLTTQLYIPAHPLNESDFLFLADCVVELDAGSREGRFDFVLPAI